MILRPILGEMLGGGRRGIAVVWPRRRRQARGAAESPPVAATEKRNLTDVRASVDHHYSATIPSKTFGLSWGFKTKPPSRQAIAISSFFKK